MHGQALLDCRGRIHEHPAIGERIRRHVENARNLNHGVSALGHCANTLRQHWIHGIHNGRELAAIHRLLLKQQLSHFVEDVNVGHQDFFGPRIALAHQVANFFVDRASRRFGVIR